MAAEAVIHDTDLRAIGDLRGCPPPWAWREGCDASIRCLPAV